MITRFAQFRAGGEYRADDFPFRLSGFLLKTGQNSMRQQRVMDIDYVIMPVYAALTLYPGINFQTIDECITFDLIVMESKNGSKLRATVPYYGFSAEAITLIEMMKH